MFISATGNVTPSGFLPLAAGNVREVMPLDVYRYAPLFRRLRQPKRLHGRCGACEFRSICGGSRARAWAATGDVYAEDPLCTWRTATA
jgi:radical SAM protein with 4Fe4S-binding SPASM domain